MKEYRICENPECRHKNDLTYMECVKCGMTLEGVIVTQEGNEEQESLNRRIEEATTYVPEGSRQTEIHKNIKLVSVKDGFEVHVPFSGCLIGREGDVSPEYFSRADHAYVSNRHARIVLNEDFYMIVDESRNGTTLNNRLLTRGEEYRI
ncbi:MAG: FHA domain-containing protein, partial [Deltaproteobacteria bacterium]|nr:FHA domain-containing protein [Deltaproteobacteria bacterium]